MGNVVVAEFLTLDGVMEANEEWQPHYVREDVAAAIQARYHASEALLLGRVTYDMLAAFWPSHTNNEFGIAEKLNSQPKFVVSSTLDKAAWNNTTVISGDAVEEIRELKRQSGGDILLVGSRTLAQTLMQVDLVDAYWLLVHPLVRGYGKQLFSDGSAGSLRLVEVTPFSSGVVAFVYQPAQEA